METKRYRHCVVLFALMAVTVAAVRLSESPPPVLQPAVTAKLPGRAAEYRGIDRFYCQNEACLKSFTAEELDGTNVCPVCGSELDRVSLPEKRILPPDSVIRKKDYIGPEGRRFSVSLVLSGSEQKSIHRPQQCLPAQGHTIESQRTLSVPIPGREPLEVMVLNLRRTRETIEGAEYTQTSAFAYWFAGPERETAYHLERLFWMSMDRIFRNITHRWAYITIAVPRHSGSEEHIEPLKDFISDFYPLIRKPH
ncbi:MAG: exosortase-associated EpsI family protein [Kiritimatiellia bacterium]